MTTINESEANSILADMQTVFNMISTGPRPDEFDNLQFAKQFGLTTKKASYELEQLVKAGKVSKRTDSRRVYFKLVKVAS
jgi:hypothetical protein